jgi:uncharacterized protein (DUF1330 family)
MAKGYWITFYRSISDPAALAAYAKLAGPAVISNGGRFLARGGTVKTYEQGIAQRTIAIEFDSVEQAIAAHDSPAYQEALAALGNTCERDMRIVEGRGLKTRAAFYSTVDVGRCGRRRCTMPHIEHLARHTGDGCSCETRPLGRQSQSTVRFI